MSRLTNKWRIKSKNEYTPKPEAFDKNQDITPLLDKLGKLEDLEEELGCPLDIIAKLALDEIEEIYTFDKLYDEYDYVEFRGFLPNKKMYVRSDFHFYWEIPLNDYKKTWWLKEDRSE